MIRWPCAVSSALISAASRYLTRPRCAASATCWKRTIWAVSCSTKCRGTWRRRGLKVATGTIVDATIINAPSSTKNAKKARDPEMHQTKKGNQWYFGMKAHLGVDSRTKLIHAAVATPANVADSTVLPDLLHGKETRVWGDQAYRGQRAVIRQHAPKALDFTNRRYRHRGVVDETERAKNRTKSKVRARVEHSIGIIKRVFGFAKVRYRGLKKNTHRLLVTCALVNLFIARRQLLRCQ
jgi:transposase, IS5 family